MHFELCVQDFGPPRICITPLQCLCFIYSHILLNTFKYTDTITCCYQIHVFVYFKHCICILLFFNFGKLTLFLRSFGLACLESSCKKTSTFPFQQLLKKRENEKATCKDGIVFVDPHHLNFIQGRATVGLSNLIQRKSKSHENIKY